MRTLYEDWKLRRGQLDTAEALPHFGEQARVLDFLLARYADDPVSREPARFPLSSEMYLDSRAIVVHHHLGRHAFNATRTPAEAHARARKILSHIADINPQESIGPPGSEIDLLRVDEKPLFSFRRDFAGLGGMAMRLSSIREGHSEMLKTRGTLPENVVDQLIHQANSIDYRNPFAEPQALDVLEQCANECVVHYFVDQWVTDARNEQFQRRAFRYLTRMREQAAEVTRARLVDPDWANRTRAVILLGYIGSLDDIGLLQDLLALPEMQKESVEREEYVNAMQVLAGMFQPAAAPA
ncbi:MAG TPA: hypothetical protein VKX17_07190 [Planctomycetota bacterium]|nr:hypothetical protein [Planctomycetota bacterium]